MPHCAKASKKGFIVALRMGSAPLMMNLRLLKSQRASSSGFDFLHEGNSPGQHNQAYVADMQPQMGSALRI